ncbi:3-hydroxyisobutyrate dehydrogenase [Tsukamurella pulmonis]|uniref:2-hydroxy-3-oxopropionate reductase n=1 Tax=Tsukamurella pulmonis TaxID=47312 RepID=A0A1H1H923_9ACTN|nr:NAD(P)-dependent oxidoreductase [Tsukamurella pulmonis]KXO94933.1 3-hydroxyisobutyrate dehydrogenase [Tsukamurella pulmonis]SDR21962.1 2-hydroxy-3-oxopropionate reductase [Tsukamurella pulmonis]SUP15561.1 2-hydroxy-3-oxopropionate reductase [Tsukamurella pulmonis]
MTDVHHPANGVALGVIGLGAMGAPMARHLARGHGRVHITARRPRPDLVADGAVQHADAAALAAVADVVLLMLPDLPEVDEVLAGGLLAGDRPLLVIIGSTSSAPGVRALAERLDRESGGRVRVVDAPVSGGEDGAIAGTLSIMMGGTEEDCALAGRVLEPCGTPVRLGPLGAGQVAKACNQLVVAATIAALGEATVLADRSGIDLRTLWDLLGGGYAASRLLDTRKEKLITGDDAPSGMAKYLLKDLRSGAEVAAATGTHAALLPALLAEFEELVDAGLGERDMAVTRRFVAEREPG